MGEIDRASLTLVLMVRILSRLERLEEVLGREYMEEDADAYREEVCGDLVKGGVNIEAKEQMILEDRQSRVREKLEPIWLKARDR